MDLILSVRNNTSDVTEKNLALIFLKLKYWSINNVTFCCNGVKVTSHRTACIGASEVLLNMHTYRLNAHCLDH